MASSEFLEVAACANAVEAEQVRNVLEENGVSAFIDGANANTALSYVGTALGGVRVIVRASDAEKATEIMESSRRESDVSVDPWFCGQCEETIDGAFELCWSCGNARADVERAFPVTRDDEHVASGFEEDDVADGPIADNAAYDDSNPYAPPMTAATAATPGDRQGEINDEAEAMLLRAWRASILGTVFLPFVLHLYSMYLLICAAATAPTFSPEGQKRFYRAFGVNMVAGCLWGVMIHVILG